MTKYQTEPQIVLDLSRLLSRIFHATPTGVDRCEMAYARGLLAAAPNRLSFAAVHPTGLYGRLCRDAVLRFLDLTEERWDHRGFSSPWEMRRFAASALLSLRPRSISGSGKPSIYLQVSPSNLTHPARIAAILRREQARFVCMLHDLIPLEYPEYARPDGADKHRQRVVTISQLADGIIANSAATLRALEPYVRETARSRYTAVAHLGVQKFNVPKTSPPIRPYFICIGTIEPRKNHLLLLNLWRQMAETKGALNIPKLVIVGRRGWENEQVVDMLERCPSLVGCVEEYNSLPDREAQSLLSLARALLLPSFAEGYGMPVVEAMALNIPVICSDLPALREAGGNIPYFLDPLDGHGWQAAINDLIENDSVIRKKQAKKRTFWTPQSWNAHLEIAQTLIYHVFNDRSQND